MSHHRRVASPPQPFLPAEVTLPAHSALYRIHPEKHQPDAFNPGSAKAVTLNRSGNISPMGRFSFFYESAAASLPVPVLYAASTENVAIWETVLRDYHRPSGITAATNIEGRALSKLITKEELRLASLAGADMATLRLPNDELICAGPHQYHQTVPWAQAAWQAGFDGIKYVSSKESSGIAYVMFPQGERSIFNNSTVEHNFDDKSNGGGFSWIAERLDRWNINIAL